MRHTNTKCQVQNHNSANIRATPDTKNRHNINPTCQNHPEKIATHILNITETPEKVYYCEKCSIMLASQGFNILKINKGNPVMRQTSNFREIYKNQRQREIEMFLGQLSWQIEEMGRRNGQVQSQLQSSNQHFNQMMTEVTSYFKQIQDIIEVQKYMSYNSILSHRTALEEQLRMVRESLQTEIEQLSGIGNDIQNNLEAVESVEEEIYQSIMNNYRNKLVVSSEYNQYQMNGVPRPRVMFPDVPKLLFSIADKIHLMGDAPLQTLSIPQDMPTSRNIPSSRSKNRSVENSQLRQTNLEQKVKKSLSNFVHLKNTESIDDKEIAFSFQSNQGANHYQTEQYPNIPKVLFADRQRKPRQSYHPHQMMFRESLSLTEIRENDQELDGCIMGRYYPNLMEDTIPEQIVTSHESLDGYFIADTLGHSVKEETSRGEQTETLLIC